MLWKKIVEIPVYHDTKWPVKTTLNFISAIHYKWNDFHYKWNDFVVLPEMELQVIQLLSKEFMFCFHANTANDVFLININNQRNIFFDEKQHE